MDVISSDIDSSYRHALFIYYYTPKPHAIHVSAHSRRAEKQNTETAAQIKENDACPLLQLADQRAYVIRPLHSGCMPTYVMVSHELLTYRSVVKDFEVFPNSLYISFIKRILYFYSAHSRIRI